MFIVCNGRGCLTCPALFNDSTIIVNGKKLELDGTLTCKDKNVIYVAQCQLCYKRKNRENPNCSIDAYFGQTKQEFRSRLNGHRAAFNNESYTSSLSEHWYKNHKGSDKKMGIFKFGIVEKTTELKLNSREAFFISQYKAKECLLNKIESPGSNK